MNLFTDEEWQRIATRRAAIDAGNYTPSAAPQDKQREES